ncbi:MAG: alcohol dehydrogenase catalytic domain-containing protein [Hyphomicrobiaceae bacterium]|nr:alcohol dehydrogenase catalytic domain-containing protein [Hyphomicrobiaceae bacterium]
MADTHRCYCVTKHNAPLELATREVATPKGREVLVKVTGAGVCHSDIHLWEGHYDLGGGKKLSLKDRGIKLPLTMGHEIAGEIIAAGPDAKGAKIGAKVVVYPWLGCGECPTCNRGDENLCLKGRSLGVFIDGGYSTHVIVPDAKYCIDLGKLDAAEAAPLACSGVTTFSALKKFGAKIKDEPVVIIGAGGLGRMAMTMLKAMGGKGAIVVDIDPVKRDGAKAAGALSVIDGGAADAAQQILTTTGGALLILDLVGAASTLNLAIASATRGTEIVVVGLFGGEVTIPVPFFPLRPLAIRGSYVGNLAELTELVDLAKAGKLELIPVNRRPLDEANAALMSLRDGKVNGRVVLVP